MLPDEPLVSVIIPVWNTAEPVKKLIKQLFGQSYRNIEIIAVDDGSSDDSLRVLEKLAETDQRLKVVHQENAGVSAARNRGIELAKGKYLIFVDSDDGVGTDFVEVLVEAMEKNPDATLALTGKRYNKLLEQKTVDSFARPRRKRRKNEKLSHYVIYLMILDGRMYSMTGKIFRTEVVQKHKIRLEVGRDFAEDTKFTMDYLAANDGEIVFIPQALYEYNFGTETSVVKKSSQDWNNWEKSYRELEAWARQEEGGRLYLGTRGLLWLVRLRWHVSHCKAKRRAKA